MWPPPVSEAVVCNYSFLGHSDHQHHQDQHNHHFDQHNHNQHDHYHHYPHTSTNNFECYQTLSCPSDLPVETSYFSPHQQLPEIVHQHHHELGSSLTHSPQEYWCPIETDCLHERCAQHWKDIPHEQSKIFEEISKECEHLLNKKDCDKCNIRHVNGKEESIEMEDLVEIVMAAAEDINKKDITKEESKLLSRKRQQNKVAAARYRDKQKSKWTILLEEKTTEEARNRSLKEEVEKLEKEVAELRELFLKKVVQKE